MAEVVRFPQSEPQWLTADDERRLDLIAGRGEVSRRATPTVKVKINLAGSESVIQASLDWDAYLYLRGRIETGVNEVVELPVEEYIDPAKTKIVVTYTSVITNHIASISRIVSQIVGPL